MLDLELLFCIQIFLLVFLTFFCLCACGAICRLPHLVAGVVASVSVSIVTIQAARFVNVKRRRRSIRVNYVLGAGQRVLMVMVVIGRHWRRRMLKMVATCLCTITWRRVLASACKRTWRHLLVVVACGCCQLLTLLGCNHCGRWTDGARVRACGGCMMQATTVGHMCYVRLRANQV